MAPRKCPARSLLRRGGVPPHLGICACCAEAARVPGCVDCREDASRRAAQRCHGATKPHLQRHPSLVLLDLGSISAATEAVAVGLCIARLLVRPWCKRSLGSPRSVWRCPRRPSTPPRGRETLASRPAARCRRWSPPLRRRSSRTRDSRPGRGPGAAPCAPSQRRAPARQTRCHRPSRGQSGCRTARKEAALSRGCAVKRKHSPVPKYCDASARHDSEAKPPKTLPSASSTTSSEGPREARRR